LTDATLEVIATIIGSMQAAAIHQFATVIFYYSFFI
jgi:hypothetical protein